MAIYKRGKTWYADMVHPKTGERLRKSLHCTLKSAAEIMERDLVRDLSLQSAGLMNPFENQQVRPLIEHVNDWHDAIIHRGNTKAHASVSKRRVIRIVDDCKFRKWSDIDPVVVQKWMKDAQSADKPIIAKTSNYYLRELKSFCLWMVRSERAGYSPVIHMQGMKTHNDPVHCCRVLESDEIIKLLDAANIGPVRLGMIGSDRAMMYRLALETGFRLSEILSLEVCDFDLGEDPTITVRAGYSKRRREDVQPIRQSFADDLHEYIAGKKTGKPVFVVNNNHKFAATVRADFEAGGMESEGVTFHGLRHTFISLLTRANVTPKNAQELARHSTITLTMDRYSHTFRPDVARSLDVLPEYKSKTKNSQGKRVMGGRSGA